MREFFKGWRKKAGCGALVMALVLAGLWWRSVFCGDFIVLWRGAGTTHHLASLDGSIKWIKSEEPTQPNEEMISLTDEAPPLYAIGMTEIFGEDLALAPVFFGSNPDWTWQRQAIGFHFGGATIFGYRCSIWQVPYWSIVLLLTLLSAYLILWKPRPKPKEPPDA